MLRWGLLTDIYFHFRAEIVSQPLLALGVRNVGCFNRATFGSRFAVIVDESYYSIVQSAPNGFQLHHAVDCRSRAHRLPALSVGHCAVYQAPRPLRSAPSGYFDGLLMFLDWHTTHSS